MLWLTCLEMHSSKPLVLQFLVKWQEYSHLHNTWESYSYLKDFKGLKRVDNYIKSGQYLACRFAH